MHTIESFEVGTPVSLIWSRMDVPQSFIGTVCGNAPFTVETTDSGDPIDDDANIKILFQSAGAFELADARVTRRFLYGHRMRYELEPKTWSRADRRAHERYPAKLMATCRFVSEDRGTLNIREFHMTTKDISLGGAWMQSDATLPSGTIMNCEFLVGQDTTVKALCVVAWEDPNAGGFGVEFFEFAQESKAALITYLKSQAA